MSNNNRAVLVARCENYREDLDEPCTGELRFRWGMSEAPCGTCGARCGVAVSAWTRVETAPEGEAGDDWRARYSALIGKVDEWVAESFGDAAREDLIADLGVDGWLRVGWPPPAPGEGQGATEGAPELWWSPSWAAVWVTDGHGFYERALTSGAFPRELPADAVRLVPAPQAEGEGETR